jgi:hypothetical protein
VTTYLEVQPAIAAAAEEEEEESDRQASECFGVSTYLLWCSGCRVRCRCGRVRWSWSCSVGRVRWSCSVLSASLPSSLAPILPILPVLQSKPLTPVNRSHYPADPLPKPQATKKRHWLNGCPKAERYQPNFLSGLRDPKTDRTRDDIEMLLSWRVRSFPATPGPPEAKGSERVTGEEVRRQNSSLASGAVGFRRTRCHGTVSDVVLESCWPPNVEVRGVSSVEPK